MREASYTPEEIGEVLRATRAVEGTTVQQAAAKGYTPAEIRAAGYTDQEIALTIADARDEEDMDCRAAYDAGFRPAELLASGYPAAEVRAVLVDLKAEGMGASEANEAGFALEELRAEAADLDE